MTAAIGASGVALAGSPGAATLAAAPTPSPSPSPAASPTPVPKIAFSYGVDSYTSAVNQQFVGPGTTPVCGVPATQARTCPTFQANPPTVPYDFFSGRPNTTGQGLSFDIIVSPKYTWYDKVSASVKLGYGSVGGAGNVISYWGGSIMPTINPHLGSNGYTLTPTFTTHNAQDSVSAARGSVLEGTVATTDGNYILNVGWFDPRVTVPFVFTPAPWPNQQTELVPQLYHSLGDGSPGTGVLKPETGALPLQGSEFVVRSHDAQLELIDANLPAPPTSPARIDSIALVQNRGDIGVKYSASVAHLTQAGPDTGRYLYGSFPSITFGNTGPLPQSTLFAQRMTLFGLGAAFPIGSSDAELRYGFSCYSADGVAVTSSGCTSGSYYYGKLHHGFTHFDTVLELVRFEARYAPAVLSYGTIENVWSVPFAYPTTFLPGSYQLVDNHDVGPNRQGLRFATNFVVAGVEARLGYARLWQIDSYDSSSAFQPGFVEPYFLPELATTGGALGYEQRLTGWFQWHPKFADVTLDLADVTAYRAGTIAHPEYTVSMNYPSAVFSLSRQFSQKLFVAGGVGRMAVDGSYNNIGPKNADLAQGVIFLGLQYQSNGSTGYGLQWRTYSTNGSSAAYPTFFPAYHGSQIQFYQRLKT